MITKERLEELVKQIDKIYNKVEKKMKKTKIKLETETIITPYLPEVPIRAISSVK